MMTWSKRNPVPDQTAHESIAPYAPPLPSPEEVFLAWLVHLPPHTDLAKAASTEIARIDRADSMVPQAERLREIFAEAVREDGRWRNIQSAPGLF